MVFSSPIFLFLFLPVVLTVYALLPGVRAKNFWLLLMSLVFYAWGEVLFIFLLLASTLMNYVLGLWVDRSQEPGRRKLAVAVAVSANIGLLAFFKYAEFCRGHAQFAAAIWLGVVADSRSPTFRCPSAFPFSRFMRFPM